jgi:hypothetical protein
MADRDILLQLIIKAATQGAIEAIKALQGIDAAQLAAAAGAQALNTAFRATADAARVAARDLARLATVQQVVGDATRDLFRQMERDAAKKKTLADMSRKDLEAELQWTRRKIRAQEQAIAQNERFEARKAQSRQRALEAEADFYRRIDRLHLQALDQNERFDEQALRSAEKAAKEQAKAREDQIKSIQDVIGKITGPLVSGFQSANTIIRDFSRRTLGGLARALTDLLNPINYVTKALSGMWDILKRAFGYALGRGLVAFIKNPIGALQQLEKTIFGLTSDLDILEIQLGVMLPRAFGTAGEAIEYLWDQVLRTSSTIEDLTATIRILTATGIDYRQWLSLISDVSAGTGRTMEQLAYAIGLVNQGMAYGLRYLKLAGINVKELGIQTTKSGRLIGNTTEIITKLFYALEEQYKGMGAAVGGTFRIVLENLMDFGSRLWTHVWGPLIDKDVGVLTQALRDLYSQFINLDKEGMTPLGNSMEALAHVVGERLAGAFVKLRRWSEDTLRGMQMDLMGFAQWGANLTAAIADGILTGINRYLIPAISAVVQILADFLAPGSPPKKGLLHYIDKWGIALFEEFLKGFALADFGVLSEATGILRTILTTMAATGDIDEKDIVPTLAKTRTQIANLLSGFRETGVWDETLLANIVDQYGRWGDEVEQLIRLHAELGAEQEKLEELEEERAGVQDEIRDTILRMRREGYTEEAIQAWRQWFEAGRLGQLDEQIDAQRDVIGELEEELSWQQALIDAQMEQAGLIEEQISLLESLEKAVKKLKKAAEGLVLGPTPQFEIDIPKLTGALDELKKEWEDVFDTLFEPFDRLETNLKAIGDFIRGFLGAKPTELTGMTGGPEGETWTTWWSEAWQAGEDLRVALNTIRTEILPFIERSFAAIAKSAELTWAWWEDIRRLLGEGGDLGWLGALLKAGAQEIGLLFTVEDPETGDSYLNMILLALGLLGLVTVGPKALLLAVAISFYIQGLGEGTRIGVSAAIQTWLQENIYDPMQKGADDTVGEGWRLALAAWNIETTKGTDEAIRLWDLYKTRWAGPEGVIPTAIRDVKDAWEAFKTELVGEEGIITLLIAAGVEAWEIFKESLIGEEGSVTALIATLIEFFKTLFAELVGGDDAWINKFVIEAKKQIQSLLKKVEHLIGRIKKLIGLQDKVGEGGGGGEGGVGQFGAYVQKAGDWLLHRGEYVLNPDYPRPDLLASFFRDVGGQMARWMPDMEAAFGALSMPAFSPSFEMVGGTSGGNITHNYYIRSLALQMERGRSLEKTLRELSKLGGIGVG